MASARTSANVAAMRAKDEQNLSLLKNQILKYNTVMPGEWVGGRIILDKPPKSRSGSRNYRISVQFGGEVHSFQVTQDRTS
jgi:hypothetical protein